VSLNWKSTVEPVNVSILSLKGVGTVGEIFQPIALVGSGVPNTSKNPFIA
jgi:hypothetical protein